MKALISSCHMSIRVLLTVTVLILFTTFSGHTALPIVEGNESPFRQIFEKVAPSVVLITVVPEKTEIQDMPFNPFERFFGSPMPQQQQRKPRPGMGSGVIIDRDGHIITNNHVVENAGKIMVKVNDEEEYEAKIVGKDPLSDLAVIKLDLEGKRLPAEYVAELGDSDTLKPGDYAIALGNPIGLERTITVGVISAIGRSGLLVSGGIRYQDFIQTDAQINPGNSGGALVDINGKVIGINNMYTEQYAAIGFSIPINLVKNVSEKLIEFGEVKRGFVGIDQSGDDLRGDITKDRQKALSLPNTDGVLVSDIIPDSPAEKAGLKHGDVIITLDNEIVKDFNHFLLKIGEHSPGDTVTLRIYRDGQQRTFSLKLADADDYIDYTSSDMPGVPGSSHSWRGIYVVDLDSQMAEQYNLEGIKSGVLVVKIDEDSPAADSNLSEGDIITEIEGKAVSNVEDFESLKNILEDKEYISIYRSRKISNGRIIKGYVAVKK